MKRKWKLLGLKNDIETLKDIYSLENSFSREGLPSLIGEQKDRIQIHITDQNGNFRRVSINEAENMNLINPKKYTPKQKNEWRLYLTQQDCENIEALYRRQDYIERKLMTDKKSKVFWMGKIDRLKERLILDVIDLKGNIKQITLEAAEHQKLIRKNEFI